MKTWRIQFWGRLKGAIGITYACEMTVDALDAEAARLKLYETHEHIHAPNVAEVKESTK